jgi:hypothetical protein
MFKPAIMSNTAHLELTVHWKDEMESCSLHQFHICFDAAAPGCLAGDPAKGVCFVIEKQKPYFHIADQCAGCQCRLGQWRGTGMQHCPWRRSKYKP